jgi:hypothetical protein
MRVSGRHYTLDAVPVSTRVSRLTFVSFTDLPKIQTLTLLKSQKRDGYSAENGGVS